MDDQESLRTRRASIGINKLTGAIQLTVPQGTKLSEAIQSLAKIDVRELERLPRGCQTCLSGHAFDIREQFEQVINVQLGR